MNCPKGLGKKCNYEDRLKEPILLGEVDMEQTERFVI